MERSAGTYKIRQILHSFKTPLLLLIIFIPGVALVAFATTMYRPATKLFICPLFKNVSYCLMNEWMNQLIN